MQRSSVVQLLRVQETATGAVFDGPYSPGRSVYLLAWRLRSRCNPGGCLGSVTSGAGCIRTGRIDAVDASPNLSLPACTTGANVLLALDTGSEFIVSLLGGGEALARDALESGGAETGDDDAIDIVHRLTIERREPRLRAIGVHRQDDVRAIQCRLRLSRGWTRGA